MYVLVQHSISDPATFWNAADPNTISPRIKLHHSFPTPDGTRAVCIWEAESVDALRDELEPLIGNSVGTSTSPWRTGKGSPVPRSFRRRPPPARQV